MGFSKYLFRLDTFGSPVMLFYQQDYKYRSLIGLVLSMSFYIFVTIYLFVGMSPLWGKNKDFQTVTETLSNQ